MQPQRVWTRTCEIARCCTRQNSRCNRRWVDGVGEMTCGLHDETSQGSQNNILRPGKPTAPRGAVAHRGHKGSKSEAHWGRIALQQRAANEADPQRMTDVMDRCAMARSAERHVAGAHARPRAEPNVSRRASMNGWPTEALLPVPRGKARYLTWASTCLKSIL